MNELISGVRADVAVKVFGDDLDTLVDSRQSASKPWRASVPGAADVKLEQTTGLPLLTIDARPAGAVALRPELRRGAGRGRHRGRRRGGRAVLRRAIAASTSSCACPKHCARIRRGWRPAGSAAAADAGHATKPAAAPTGAAAAPASCRCARSPASSRPKGPNQINRENGKRRVVVTANVRGRDLGGFVAELRAAHRRATSRCPAATGSTTAAPSSS